MGFFWRCPGCKTEYFYRGSKTTDAVTTCTPCSLKLKIFKYRIIEKPPETTDKLPKTTTKLQPIEYNGMVQSLIIALTYAINTVKNKKQVKAKDEDSTWYQHYRSWTRIRKYFQSLEEEKR